MPRVGSQKPRLTRGVWGVTASAVSAQEGSRAGLSHLLPCALPAALPFPAGAGPSHLLLLLPVQFVSSVKMSLLSPWAELSGYFFLLSFTVSLCTRVSVGSFSEVGPAC